METVVIPMTHAQVKALLSYIATLQAESQSEWGDFKPSEDPAGLIELVAQALDTLEGAHGGDRISQEWEG